MSFYKSSHKPYRSFFWPVILVGIGVIWLLVNLGIIPTTNLWLLLKLWPMLIIVAGLDILFARRLSLLGAILGLLLIAGVVFILLNGEQLNLGDKPEPQTEVFSIKVDDTELAHFTLGLSTQETKISALQNSTNLLDAEIGHYGTLDFRVTGEKEKFITLEQEGVMFWPFWFAPADPSLVWEIGLNPDVPFDLDVDGSTGDADLDLTGLRLEKFRFNGSTGASEISLPAMPESYQVYIDGSTGAVDVLLPAESDITLRVDGSTGKITFDVSEETAVKIEVLSGGTGDLVFPDWIRKVSGFEDRDEGVYTSEGFDDAKNQLLIIVEDISTGNIIIK